MPQYSDDEDEGDRYERKQSERESGAGKEMTSTRDLITGSSKDKDDEARRIIRWTSFAKPKLVLGFNLLSQAYVPSMSNKAKGYSVCFERVLGFPIPSSLLADVDQGGYDVYVQLSMSLFHMTSVNFFGSTWMGSPLLLSAGAGDRGKQLPKEVDFDCNEMVYLLSRITDPSCVGVVEVVVSKKKADSDVTVAQYGCGWTMVNLFAVQPPPADIAEGHENITVTNVPLFYGSPRDLLISSSMQKLEATLKEIPKCTMDFKLYSHRKLIRSQRLLAENEIVGRFDVIAGLAPKEVTPTGSTRVASIACVGDEGGISGKNVVMNLPATPKVHIPSTLEVKELDIIVNSGRVNLENRMLNGIATNMSFENGKAQILNRRLKVGLHNGHTVLAGEFQSYPLFESKDEPNVLMVEENILVRGYVPHELMALVFLVEYDVGMPYDRHQNFNTQALLKNMSKVRDGHMVTTVVMGVSVYIPFNGKKVVLKNCPGDHEDQADIELQLRSDKLCNLFTHKPIFTDKEGKIERRMKTSGASKSSSLYGDDDEDIIVSFNMSEDSHVGLTKSMDTTIGAAGEDNEDAAPVDSDDDRVLTKSAGGAAHASRDRTLRSSSNAAPKTPERANDTIRASQRSFDKSKFEDRASEDSLIVGEAGASNLRLEAFHYQNASRSRGGADGDRDAGYGADYADVERNALPVSASVDRGGRSSGTERAPQKGSLLSRSMGAPVFGDVSRFGEDPVSRKHAVDPVYVDKAEHSRGISRGARARLNRHGFEGAIMDDMAAPAAHLYPKLSRAISAAANVHVDVSKEVTDPLSLHDITLQFAGIQYGDQGKTDQAHGASAPKTHTRKPRSVYFSYQFYTCDATRTEVLKLLPADNGKMHVLARDDAYARNEPPLSLRYVVDTSTSSVTEPVEFAQYLATKTLHIDVWDSDSLMLLGTCGVPLKRIMRQGAQSTRCAIECDIIDSEADVQSSGGMTTCAIRAGSNMSGKVVGAVHVILSNLGQPGRNRENMRQQLVSKGQADARYNRNGDAVDGLNWRVGTDKQLSSKNSNRARNAVRARPLAETYPELAETLAGHREHSVGGKEAMRSLTSVRGDDTVHTLNYDDVVTLFKEFGGKHGTVQYTNRLMSLLDVPSWGITLRKFLKCYAADQGVFAEQALRYSDPEERLTPGDLAEFVRATFERCNVRAKPEEVALLVKHFTDSKGDNPLVKASEVISFCEKEGEAQAWGLTSRRLIRAIQDCYLIGIDFEQLLAEKDLTGDHHVLIKDFKECLFAISRQGKLDADDITRTVRHFSRQGGAGGHQSISLKDVMKFVGKTYVGNIEVRMAAVLTEGGRTVDAIRAALGSGMQAYEQMESKISKLGAYNVLSNDQVRKILSKADSDGSGTVSADQLLSLLRLKGKATVSSQALDGADAAAAAENLLRVLVARVTANGLSITEAFRGFDLDGDGSISQDELLEAFSKLGIFENLPDWKATIPAIVKKFDKNGDGCLNLKEFFTELFGVKDYAANFVQDLTKIFATATDAHGMTMKAIFDEWDLQRKGAIDIAELTHGLNSMGTLGNITEEDAKNVMQEIGANGETVSFAVFDGFFGARVAQAVSSRRRRKVARIVTKFQSVVNAVLEQTKSTLAEVFAHFDSNRDGDISIAEFKATLRVMKHFKSLTDEELDLLLSSIDSDNSGSINFNEFIAFLNIKDTTSATSIVITDVIAPKIRKVLESAIDKGLSLDQLFAQGDLTTSELCAVLDTLAAKYHPVVTSDETLQFVKFLDRNRNDSISQGEIIIFLAAGKRQAAKAEAAAASPNDTPDEAFLKKEIRRVAAHDGGVQSMLALMDRNGTGYVSFASFMHFLKREGVFESAKEESSVSAVLEPMGKDGQISVLALMRWLDGHKPDHSGALTVLDSEESSLMEYEFSRDPEIHALEKKLRRLGRIMAKQGINVEGLFRQYDRLDLGLVRRTEFIEVLSKMGMSILEQGRIMGEGLAVGQGQGSTDAVSQTQRRQVQRLKGPTYKNDAPSAARRLMNGAKDDSPDFREHMESMALVNSYRQSQKKQLLQQVLSHTLATDVRVYPRFGKTLFFEQPFTNPFNHEERFIIDVNDPELRVVTSFDEWIQLRDCVEPCAGVLGPAPIETDMFDRDAYGNIQVALLPHETLYVPFTFMTLVPHTAPAPSARRSARSGGGRGGNESKGGDSKDARDDGPKSNFALITEEKDESPRRSVEVKFISGGHGTYVSVLNVLVCPRPFIVDRTLRFFEPENSVMKRRIHLVDFGSRNILPGDTAMAGKFVHCVENDNVLYGGKAGQSNVVIEWGETSTGGNLEMILRYRCGTFPAIGSFYILLYNDAYQSQQHEIWKVVVQSRQRLDVHGPVGSSSLLDLIVKGDKFARRARAHASYTTDHLTFTPDAPFQLVPGAYNRVALRFSPVEIGTKRLQVNLVDVDSKELISSWLLTTTATAPAVTRSYDVDVLDGRPIHKKIIFRNPWDVARKFILTSSDESIMRVRVPTVEVSPRGSAYLRLWFDAGAETQDAYLFLTDASTGQNEESFLFRVHVAR